MKLPRIPNATLSLTATIAEMNAASTGGVDHRWFDASRPCDGARHALGGGSAISFFSPASHDGSLFILVVVGPLGRLKFTASNFACVLPKPADAVLSFTPVLSQIDGHSVSDDVAKRFAVTSTLLNTSLSARRFNLRIASPAELPERFTLLLPNIRGYVRTFIPLQAQFRRFGDEKAVRMCGVNGTTSGAGFRA
jgi:hypothetical protein